MVLVGRLEKVCMELLVGVLVGIVKVFVSVFL